MSPLTIAALLSALQMNGPGSAIASDNSGIQSVLNGIASQMRTDAAPNGETVLARNYSRTNYSRTDYYKTDYHKSSYSKG